MGSDLDERVVGVRPDLRQVEGVEAVGLRVLVWHHLHVEIPGREVARLDGLVEVAAIVIGVCAGDDLGLPGLDLDIALVGREVVLHPEPLASSVDPLVGVRTEAGHLTPRTRQAAVAHEVGDLVGGLRRERPEVPLHVGVAQARPRQPLLRVDEVRELDAVADEEHRGVVADDVVVAFRGVELHREATHIAPGVWTALLAGDTREALQGLGGRARLEHRGPGVLRDVLRHLEGAERSAALRVHDPLRNTLAIELGELFHQVAVVECGHPIDACGERMLVALHRGSGLGGQ